MRKNQLLSRLFIFAAAAVPLALATVAQAQNTPGPASIAAEASAQELSYAQYFGDGLREFGEGNYEKAIPNLLRAYALDSKAETLGFVIAAYDEMGFCDAASRQTEVFKAAHAGEDTPEPSRCAQAGTVELECVGVGGLLAGEPARVDGRFDVACGRTLRLPVGEHEFAVGQGETKNSRRRIRVLENKTVSLRLESFGEPKRWRAAGGPEVAQLSDLPAHVERVRDAEVGYTVFLTQDGIYRVFVQASPTQAPAFFDLPFRPNILRLCDSGERFDERSHQCVPVKGMMIQKFK